VIDAAVDGAGIRGPAVARVPGEPVSAGVPAPAIARRAADETERAL